MKYKELTNDIINAAHNVPGFGFLEKVYQNALLIELRKREVKVDAPVKSRNIHNFVIPVKTGIQCF